MQFGLLLFTDTTSLNPWIVIESWWWKVDIFEYECGLYGSDDFIVITAIRIVVENDDCNCMVTSREQSALRDSELRRRVVK